VSSKPHFLVSLLTPSGGAGHRVVHERTGVTVAEHIELAHDSKTRTRGLLGREGLADDSVMVIAPCNAIHTLFMRFTIDAVFADREGRVRKLYRRLKPWRVAIAPRAFAVLELPEGSIDRFGIGPGDQLSIY
jgi:uncharacterized membrane protein (UPF0127 family)